MRAGSPDKTGKMKDSLNRHHHLLWPDQELHQLWREKVIQEKIGMKWMRGRKIMMIIFYLLIFFFSRWRKVEKRISTTRERESGFRMNEWVVCEISFSFRMSNLVVVATELVMQFVKRMNLWKKEEYDAYFQVKWNKKVKRKERWEGWKMKMKHPLIF